MESFELRPDKARALGNVMDSKDDETRMVAGYSIISKPDTTVDYDHIDFPLFNMAVDPDMYKTVLTLSASKTSLAINETAILTAKIVDKNNNPIQGLTIDFYQGSTSSASVVTNSDGVATYNFSKNSLSTTVITAEFSGTSRYGESTASVTVNVNSKLKTAVTSFVAKQNGSTVMTAPTSEEVTICNQYPLVLEWTVKDSNGDDVESDCKIYNSGTVVDTISAGTNTYTIPTTSIEQSAHYDYYIEVLESSTTNSCISDILEFYGNVYKEPSINATISNNEVTIGESSIITGTVTDQNSNPISGVTVKLEKSEWNYNSLHPNYSYIGTSAIGVTDSNGIVTFKLDTSTTGSGEYYLTCGRFNYSLQIDSAFCLDSAESDEMNLNILKITPTLNVSDLECTAGYCNLTASLKNGSKGISGEELTCTIGSDVYSATTSSNGNATFDLTSLNAGDYEATIEWIPPITEGVSIYNEYQNYKETITITIYDDNELTITSFNVSTSEGSLSTTSPYCCISPSEELTFTLTVKTTFGRAVKGLRAAVIIGDTLVEGITNNEGKITASEVAPPSGNPTIYAQVPSQVNSQDGISYYGDTKYFSELIIEDSTTAACEDYIS